MSRADLDIHFSKIDELIAEMNSLVPPDSYQKVQFRSDLAGMLVVTISATYETCVKEILHEHAKNHHSAFGEYVLRNYEKLNSRIKINDLNGYCKTFSPKIHQMFKSKLADKRKKILSKVGKNIETSYEQILEWRHHFAHASIRQTTIEEAVITHKLGKRVIYTFDYAFSHLHQIP